MKQVIILTLLFAFAAASFAQQLPASKHTLTKTDYLEKSKKQKKAASILLAAGGGLIITSLVFPKGELVHDGICIGYFCSDKYKNDGIRSGIFIAGGVAALSSIPLFIASGKNRRRAGSTAFYLDMERAPILQHATVSNKSFPVVGLKLRL